jgi:hypothetical protein
MSAFFIVADNRIGFARMSTGNPRGLLGRADLLSSGAKRHGLRLAQRI